MVSTRGHPKAFPAAPAATPEPKSSTRSRSSRSSETTSEDLSPVSPTATSTKRLAAGKWTHTPSNLTLVWLALSLPLVIWDTGYVLLRPHSMPGGFLHEPIWKPYALYGTVDYIYGFPAWEARNGFTAAQGTLNVVETLGYLVYLGIVYYYGVEEHAKKGRGAPKKAANPRSNSVLGKLVRARAVGGRPAGVAALLAFSMAVMTVSKTVLYWLNEAFSGFDNIGHNDFASLVTLWIIPNGAWLVFPSYMIYVFGREILQAMDVATGDVKKTA